MKISENCYALTGLSFVLPYTVNAGFVAGGDSTLVIDAGANYLSAQTIHGYAHNLKPNNDLMVINTEPHFDHVGGNSFFADRDIDIHAHPELERTNRELEATKQELLSAITDDTRREAGEIELFYCNTRVANPNKAVQNGQIFDLGGVQVRTIYTPGHTPKNISCFVLPDKVLYCGDCIVNGYIPNLEEGGKPEWQTWLESLDRIAALAPRVIVPGHGDVLTGIRIQPAIDRMRSILSRAIETNRPPA